MIYNVEWQSGNEDWMHYSSHLFLSRAKSTACKQLAQRHTVNNWRVVDKNGKMVYTFSKMNAWGL